MLIVVWHPLLAEILAGLPTALVGETPRVAAHDDNALDDKLVVDGGRRTNGRLSLSKKEHIADRNRTALPFAMVRARVVMLGWGCFTALQVAACCGIRVQSRANCTQRTTDLPIHLPSSHAISWT